MKASERRRIVEEFRRTAIAEGEGFRKTWHLAPPRELELEATGSLLAPAWSTRCGLEYGDRRWQGLLIGGGPTPEDKWCDDCLAQAGLVIAPLTDALYDAALREWIGRRLRPGPLTAEDVRKVQFGIDLGWGGSDVTPPDDPEPVIRFEVRRDGKWRGDEMHLPPLAEVVRECLGVANELRLVSTTT